MNQISPEKDKHNHSHIHLLTLRFVLPLQRGIDPATRQDPSMMAMLLEMGFRDQRLNQQLLRKHGFSLLHTVNELVQMAEDSQNKADNTHHWGRGMLLSGCKRVTGTKLFHFET